MSKGRQCKVVALVVREGNIFGLLDLWQVYYVLAEIHRRTYK